MSGPKGGTYINYRAEIEQEVGVAEGYISELEKTLRSLRRNLELEEEEKRIIEQHGKEEWDKEAKKLKSYISKISSSVKSLKEELKVTSYNSRTLSKVRNVKNKVKDLLKETREKDKDFRKVKSKIVSLSKEKAEEYRCRTEEELRKSIEPNLLFLEEWANDGNVDTLKAKLDNFSSIDFSQVEEERESILNLYHELYNKALKNKKDFEVKKDTSGKLIESLCELNYTNIERKLEGGPFGKIIVKAESPYGSWNVVYEIDNNGQIKAITPEDDRCYTNLKDINEKLKDYGIDIDLKELRKGKREPEEVREEKEKKIKGR